MRLGVRDIVGIQNNISELKAKGVLISDVDVSIADALFSITQRSVKRVYEDMDGLSVASTDGFIYDAQAAQLMKSFPNAVLLLGTLDRKKNYGFVKPDGSVYRTGMMGDIDPVIEAREMMTAYAGKKHTGPQLYTSEQAYQAFKDGRSRKAFDDRMSAMYGSHYGEVQEMFEYNYNHVSTGNGERLRVRQF